MKTNKHWKTWIVLGLTIVVFVLLVLPDAQARRRRRFRSIRNRNRIEIRTGSSRSVPTPDAARIELGEQRNSILLDIVPTDSAAAAVDSKDKISKLTEALRNDVVDSLPAIGGDSTDGVAPFMSESLLAGLPRLSDVRNNILKYSPDRVAGIPMDAGRDAAYGRVIAGLRHLRHRHKAAPPCDELAEELRELCYQELFRGDMVLIQKHLNEWQRFTAR